MFTLHCSHTTYMFSILNYFRIPASIILLILFPSAENAIPQTVETPPDNSQPNSACYRQLNVYHLINPHTILFVLL